MARDKKLIQFYLTNRCNSHCKTCSIWKTKIKEQVHMPYEAVSSICINHKDDADFVLGGGEFTQYRYRHDLLEVLDENNVNYTVLTNAVSLSSFKTLIELHNIKNVTISCDGLEHDKIRGVNGNLRNIATIIVSYKSIIDNLKLSYTYSRFNEDTFEEDMDYIKYWLGFDKVYFCIAQDMELLMTKGAIKPKSLEKILKRSDMLYDKDRVFIENLLDGKKRKCNSTDSVFTVYTNGDVVTCQSFMSKKVLGNIFESDFDTIINSAKVFDCPYDSECNLLCQRRYD